MGRTHPAGPQTASRTCLAIFPTNSADGPPVPSSDRCGGEQSKEDETGKVKMRKQNKKLDRINNHTGHFFISFISHLEESTSMQDILHYWHKCDAAALHCCGELCRFSHIHARHLSPVWLGSSGAATSYVKGDTSVQKCFLSRKQRLGILPRSFNCKSRCKEDFCSKYARRGINKKPVMQTHTETFTADRNNIMLKNL